MPHAAMSLPNLTGLPAITAAQKIADAGFELRSSTKGGYLRYVHQDGSKLWIKPTGEVVRLGPKITSGGGKKYNPRYDQAGRLTKSHSTGEVIGP